ncbi:MAG: 4-(cytidine 5'-diphospho)-2-C-methyl-D-erythritol kinase [Clostridia bacterium]|nr:4-(cytidine 5'-diphospho)-2-C-methyl-D-erythritol kinase [Clostridia bacterium]
MRCERANAKINLYLDVVSRRENGYHNLVSLMQTVSLCDLVTLDFHPGSHTSIRLEASGNADMPTDCRNLAWRAAERFLEASGRRGEVFISIEKHIPMAAGLAGGSADAAAVLRGLNALCGSPLSVGELCAIGERLGADVPFCTVGGCALVTGIGECLEEMPSMPALPMVVACMGEGVSTPAAYGKLDALHGFFETPTPEDPRVDRLCAALRQGSISEALEDFYNRFEEVVPLEQPCVDPIKRTMCGCGAKKAMMSGSGPSVFGVFSTQEDAIRAVDALVSMGATAFVCTPRPKFVRTS